MPRALYIDFNSYFAAVEQQRHPGLRGKPVAVVPVMADTTCCIASSYEARKFGVKTGTQVREAKRLCPGLKLIEAEPVVYVDYHHRLVEAVESCAHVEKVLSIDEMYCELHGREQHSGLAVALARQIKSAIAARVGAELRCSIGIAPNVFLAKTATELQKPDGLTVIEKKDLPDCLFGLKLRDLCGIGRQIEKRLNAHGITSVEALCNANEMQLRQAWGGIGGPDMHAKLRGEWADDLPTERSSVGHSHVLPPALRSHRSAYSVLSRLLQKAAVRLRNYGLIAGAMHIHVGRLDGSSWKEQVRLDPTQDTLQFLDALKALWAHHPGSRAAPVKVGIALADLRGQSSQSRSLFHDIEARNRLNASIDSLNSKYGKNTVYFGGAYQALKSAPMRIAFSHIPDPATEGD
jgi:DNA polymerase-4